MTQLCKTDTLENYMDLLADPQRVARMPYDDCLGWSQTQKALYLKLLAERLDRRGLRVHFADHYYPRGADLDRKPWELGEDAAKRAVRPVPIGELDPDNNIYLNIGTVGFISSFFTILHLYGHRVQTGWMEQRPDSPEGRHYRNVTKYVDWPKPLDMAEVYDDYRRNSGKPDADYEADFYAFEREAFAYGLGLLKGQPELDARMQYAINTYIKVDFEEIQSWWQSKPIKSGTDFNDRYAKLHGKFESNLGATAPGYVPIRPKASPFRKFGAAGSGVVVVRSGVNI